MEEERILIAYASKHGATAQIAERIGSILKDRGMVVDVMAVDHAADLNGYAAIVLGIAVYMGRWRREAVRFLQQHEQTLASRPLWLFTSGPTGEGDPVELVEGFAVPPSQRSLIDRIQPREIRVFHGSLTPEDLSGFERWILNRVKAKTGDFRDWKAIEDWADTIAHASPEVG